MAEKPIIFCGGMVRAILEDRKRQSRRVVKTTKHRDYGCELSPCEIAGEIQRGDFRCCPYPIGTRLWVRETWRPLSDDGVPMVPDDDGALPVEYRADADFVHGHGVAWRPSMFMPRLASRITLEVTDVRVQRVQEITPADAKAEGDHERSGKLGYYERGALCHVDWYRMVWDGINEKRGFGWAVNPWIWAYTFRALEVQR